MSITTTQFTGFSGTQYTFQVYDRETDFKPLGAVYFFTKEHIRGAHTPIYVGQTSDLSSRFDGHHRMPCIIGQGSNRICVLQQSNLAVRETIEADLRLKYTPPCNKQ